MNRTRRTSIINKFSKSLCLSIFFVWAFTFSANAQCWQNFGDAGFTTTFRPVFYPTANNELAIDGAGNAYLALQALDTGLIEIWRNDGSGWSDLFSINEPAYESGAFKNLSIAISPTNEVYIAFSDAANSDAISVITFNGTDWVYVGEAGFNGEQGYDPSLAFLNDELHVLFVDSAFGSAARAMKFSGGSWIDVGTPGFSGTFVAGCQLAFDDLGLGYALFQNGDSDASVMTFDGTDWTQLGADGINGGFVRDLSFALDDDGIPYVGYIDVLSSGLAYVSRFNGSAWELVGGAEINSNSMAEIDIVFLSGLPVVSLIDESNDRTITVGFFDGSEWFGLGEQPINSSAAGSISLSVFDDEPYIAFSEESQGNASSVLRYTSIGAPTAVITSFGTVIDCNDGLGLDAFDSFGDNPLSYLWSTGDTSEFILVFDAGTYELEVTDEVTGCTDVTDITLTQGGAIAMIEQSAPFINGLSPSITLDASSSGGIPPLLFSWSNGSTDSSIEVDAEGFYEVFVTEESTGCSSIASVEIFESFGDCSIAFAINSFEFTCDITEININLDPDYDGGGSLPVNVFYEWSDGSTESSFTATTPGEYYAIAYDEFMYCADSIPFTLTSNTTAPDVIIDTPFGIDLDCLVPDLILDAGLSTSAGGHDFLWSTGDTSSFISVFSAGIYSVLVTDLINGCTNESSIEVFDNSVLPIASITSDFPQFDCNSPGTITLDASGSTAQGSLLYLWEDSSTDSTLQINTAGDYRVTITDTANACTSEVGIAILESFEQPIADISSIGTTLTCNVGSIELDAGGSIDIVGDGISFLWSDNSTAETLTINDIGNYSVTVTGANGCFGVSSISIDENNTDPIANILESGTTLDCILTSINLDASSSISSNNNLSFLWSDVNGSSSASIDVSNAAIYTVTVTDNINGCTAEESIEVFDDINDPVISITSPGTELNCGVASIILDATATTGFGTLSYEWSVGSTIVGNDPTLEVMVGDTYSLLVSDADNFCSSIENVTISEDFTIPSIDISADNSLLNCAVGSINLMVENISSSGTLTYLWTGNVSGDQLNISSPGTYEVTATDISNSCTAMTSIVIGDDLSQPIADIDAASSSLTCANPNLVLDGTNSFGDNPLSYSWSTGQSDPSITINSPGIYDLTVTDNVSACSDVVSLQIDMGAANVSSNSPVCVSDQLQLSALDTDAVSWSWTGPNGFTSADQQPVINNVNFNAAGTYNLIYTDAVGCTMQGSTMAVIESLPTLSVTGNMNVTVGDDINIMATGNAQNWTWTGPNGFFQNGGNSILISNATAANGGTYTVEALGGNSCRSELDFEIEIVTLIPSAGDDLTVCAGEDVQLTESGVGAVNWTWTGPNGFTSNDQNPLISMASSAATGTYIVEVTDSFGNMATDETIVTVLSLPSINITGTSQVCEQEEISVQETSAEFTSAFAWTGPNGFTSSQRNFTLSNAEVVQSGTYTLIVTGSNGCSIQDDFDVIVNTRPSIDLSSNSPVCEGESLTITDNAAQGVEWDWSNTTSATDNGSEIIFSNASTDLNGTFSVVVTDANSCQSDASIQLEIFETPEIALTSNLPLCIGEELNLSENAGEADFWMWEIGALSFAEQSISVSSEDLTGNTSISLTVSNQDACEASEVIAIELIDNTTFVPSIFLVGQTACVGQGLRFIDFSTMDIDPVFAFNWNFGDGASSTERDPVHAFETAGTYIVQLSMTGGECPNPAILEKEIIITDCRLDNIGSNYSSLMPTVNNGLFDLKVLLPEDSDASINIYNLQGILVQSESLESVSDFSRKYIIENSGVHFVQVRHKFGTEILKTIVRKD